MSVGTCKEPTCGATFLWAKTTKGRMMPIDAERLPSGKVRPLEVADGNVEDTGETAWGRDGVRVPVVRVLGPVEAAQPSLLPRWRPHHASCKKPEAFRRRRSGGRASGRRGRWEE